ncbi:hypothetical protein OROMI_019889 [Orobanche minor]
MLRYPSHLQSWLHNPPSPKTISLKNPYFIIWNLMAKKINESFRSEISSCVHSLLLCSRGGSHYKCGLDIQPLIFQLSYVMEPFTSPIMVTQHSISKDNIIQKIPTSSSSQNRHWNLMAKKINESFRSEISSYLHSLLLCSRGGSHYKCGLDIQPLIFQLSYVMEPFTSPIMVTQPSISKDNIIQKIPTSSSSQNRHWNMMAKKINESFRSEISSCLHSLLLCGRNFVKKPKTECSLTSFAFNKQLEQEQGLLPFSNRVPSVFCPQGLLRQWLRNYFM